MGLGHGDWLLFKPWNRGMWTGHGFNPVDLGPMTMGHGYFNSVTGGSGRLNRDW